MFIIQMSPRSRIYLHQVLPKWRLRRLARKQLLGKHLRSQPLKATCSGGGHIDRLIEALFWTFIA